MVHSLSSSAAQDRKLHSENSGFHSVEHLRLREGEKQLVKGSLAFLLWESEKETKARCLQPSAACACAAAEFKDATTRDPKLYYYSLSFVCAFEAEYSIIMQR